METLLVLRKIPRKLLDISPVKYDVCIILVYGIYVDIQNWSEDHLEETYNLRVLHSTQSMTLFICTLSNILLHISIRKKSLRLAVLYFKLRQAIGMIAVLLEYFYLNEAEKIKAQQTHPTTASTSLRHGIKGLYILCLIHHFIWCKKHQSVLRCQKVYQPISSKRYYWGVPVKYWIFIDALLYVRLLASTIVHLHNTLWAQSESPEDTMIYQSLSYTIHSFAAFLATYSVIKRDKRKLQYSFWIRHIAMLIYLWSLTFPGGSPDLILRRAVFTRGIVPEEFSKIFTNLVWLPFTIFRFIVVMVCSREFIEQLSDEEKVRNNSIVPTNLLYSEMDQAYSKKVWKSQMKRLKKEDRKVIRLSNLNPRYLEIDPSNCLGVGQFSRVYKGRMGLMKKEVVAVKMTRVKMTKEYISCLLLQIKKLLFTQNHKNIIRFYGFLRLSTSQYGNIGIVMEYCEIGCMVNYLHRIRQYQALSSASVTEELSGFAYETALGLEYLSSKKVIHGDVACRNLLLTGDKTVKITDFGLSLKLYNTQEYARSEQQIFPWKWMAPEALLDLKFSIQSDIWSYGVLLWELYTLGSDPYSGTSWTSDFVNDLKHGSRLEKPDLANEKIYQIMQSCWKPEPLDRMAFEEIIKVFEQLNGVVSS